MRHVHRREQPLRHVDADRFERFHRVLDVGLVAAGERVRHHRGDRAAHQRLRGARSELVEDVLRRASARGVFRTRSLLFVKQILIQRRARCEQRAVRRSESSGDDAPALAGTARRLRSSLARCRRCARARRRAPARSRSAAAASGGTSTVTSMSPRSLSSLQRRRRPAHDARIARRRPALAITVAAASAVGRGARRARSRCRQCRGEKLRPRQPLVATPRTGMPASSVEVGRRAHDRPTAAQLEAREIGEHADAVLRGLRSRCSAMSPPLLIHARSMPSRAKARDQFLARRCPRRPPSA